MLKSEQIVSYISMSSMELILHICFYRLTTNESWTNLDTINITGLTSDFGIILNLSLCIIPWQNDPLICFFKNLAFLLLFVFLLFFYFYNIHAYSELIFKIH